MSLTDGEQTAQSFPNVQGFKVTVKEAASETLLCCVLSHGWELWGLESGGLWFYIYLLAWLRGNVSPPYHEG